MLDNIKHTNGKTTHISRLLTRMKRSHSSFLYKTYWILSILANMLQRKLFLSSPEVKWKWGNKVKKATPWVLMTWEFYEWETNPYIFKTSVFSPLFSSCRYVCLVRIRITCVLGMQNWSISNSFDFTFFFDKICENACVSNIKIKTLC